MGKGERSCLSICGLYDSLPHVAVRVRLRLCENTKETKPKEKQLSEQIPCRVGGPLLPKQDNNQKKEKHKTVFSTSAYFARQ
jgi:hypothetical protein